jgi:REP element-mobilizing transposase RayT
MTQPRKKQICLEQTHFYHCISRCVRGFFYCGHNRLTNADCSHRKDWIESRMKKLASVYAIDISAFAIMDNHYHLVLYVNSNQAQSWTDAEVVNRWSLIHKVDDKIIQASQGKVSDEAALLMASKIITEYRERLMSISWFMKELNEYIAKRANQEDNQSGHFWQARFKCQALLDMPAILACMVYVDLNPIRAKMADNLKTSDYTSIQQRLGIEPQRHQTNCDDENEESKQEQDPLHHLPYAPLQKFAGSSHKDNNRDEIQFELLNYIHLVDWTSRQIRPDKSGHVASSTPAILNQLNITEENWLEFTSHIESSFYQAIGDEKSIRNFSAHHKRKRVNNINTVRRIYATPSVLMS